MTICEKRCSICNEELRRGRKYCSYRCAGMAKKCMVWPKKTEEHKKKIALSHIGKSFTLATKKKISNTLKAKYANGEIVHPTKGKLVPSLSGPNNPMYGKKRPDLSERNKSNPMDGEKNPSWKGGVSSLPYGPGFTKKLKRELKERDGNSCQTCGFLPEKDNKRIFLTIHHIDHDKNNNNRTNLITLCNACNSKANFNAEVWQSLYEVMMEERYGEKA